MSKRTGKNIICKNCKKSFYASGWEIKGGKKFCSNLCYKGYGLVKIKCKICKKDFITPKSTLKKNRSFCSKKCWKVWFKGSNTGRWKNGRMKSGNYIYIYAPDNPSAKRSNHIAEHRFIMEKKIGRYLNSTEIVHHINGITTDNRIENLVITNRSNHRKMHITRCHCGKFLDKHNKCNFCGG